LLADEEGEEEAAEEEEEEEDGEALSRSKTEEKIFPAPEAMKREGDNTKRESQLGLGASAGAGRS